MTETKIAQTLRVGVSGQHPTPLQSVAAALDLPTDARGQPSKDALLQVLLKHNVAIPFVAFVIAKPIPAALSGHATAGAAAAVPCDLAAVATALDLPRFNYGRPLMSAGDGSPPAKAVATLALVELHSEEEVARVRASPNVTLVELVAKTSKLDANVRFQTLLSDPSGQVKVAQALELFLKAHH